MALETGLLLAGAVVLSLLHLTVLSLFGWPSVPQGIPVAISIVHGFQWGFGGIALLVIGAILVAPYQGRSFGQCLRIGAHFLYGAFLAHALFDAHFGGDWIDPVLYSASAAMVVLAAVLVFQLAGEG
ncbi:MAG TPA: hypothetical protein VFK10_18070 [Burkholderiaceae bacterium]|nr:hypothetical protein [Burkholderiaceae bacterium]